MSVFRPASSARLLVLALALLAGACATPPQAPSQSLAADAARAGDFACSGRFSVRVAANGEGSGRSASGRLDWQRHGDRDLILLASPLGQGIAEIEQGPALTRVRLADGRVYESADPASLLADLLGYRLPLASLGDWLLGRGSAQARLERDAAGRPLKLVDQGWRIAYVYASDDAQALPVRLDLDYGEEIEVRLRIEEWSGAQS